MNFYVSPDIDSKELDKMVPLCLSNPGVAATEDFNLDEEEDW